MEGFEVRKTTWDSAKDLILTKHYAQRRPQVSQVWGLFCGSDMVGAMTIGKPASPPLCVGLAGASYSSQVFELNRLVVLDGLPENALSFFVGAVMRSLRDSDIILVSFADEGAGHYGYIYQATNWWYTGRSKARTDKYMPGGKHPRHYTNEFSHLRRLRTPKHRYVFVPNRSLRKRVKKDMLYPILPYPKGDNTRYTLGDRIGTVVLDTVTGETFND